VGPNLLCLQKHFWDNVKMVCCAGGSFGKSFGAYRGVMQGGPLSSLMFNVCVNAVIKECCQVLGDDAAQGGTGGASRDYAVAFFIDNRLVATRCLEWLRSLLSILITLFECIGLQTNTEKTQVMTCLPGKIWIA
jgi:hypothetical protein